MRSRRFIDITANLPSAAKAVQAEKLVQRLLEKHGMDHGRYWVTANSELVPLITEIQGRGSVMPPAGSQKSADLPFWAQVGSLARSPALPHRPRGIRAG